MLLQPEIMKIDSFSLQLIVSIDVYFILYYFNESENGSLSPDYFLKLRIKRMSLTTNIGFSKNQTRKEIELFHADHSERIIPIPEEIGQGKVISIAIREGLALTIVECQILDEKVTGKPKVSSDFLQLVFYLAGRNAESHIDGRKKPISINKGDSFILSPQLSQATEVFGNQFFHVATLLIKLSELNLFVEEAGHLMPDDFSKMIEGGTLSDPYYQSSNITASMQIVLHQIVNCPYQGRLKQMYLEGKVLELTSLRLAQLLTEEKEPHALALRPTDIDRIRHAKDILIQNMETPPTLTELANLVCLNTTKLKIGFKEVFNKTVFGYLRDIRMDYARLLFEDGKMNVNEVSYNIGYADVSRFIHLFKERFGVYPGSLLK